MTLTHAPTLGARPQGRALGLMPSGISRTQHDEIIKACRGYIQMMRGMHWLLNAASCVNQASTEVLTESQAISFSWHREAIGALWIEATNATR